MQGNEKDYANDKVTFEDGCFSQVCENSDIRENICLLQHTASLYNVGLKDHILVFFTEIFADMHCETTTLKKCK